MSFGVTVNTSTAPPASGTPSETDIWHVTGPAGAGTVDSPVMCESIDDFVAAFADRSNAGTTATYDALDAFFREGGARVNFARWSVDYTDGLTALNNTKYGPGQMSVLGVAPSAAVWANVKTVADACNRVVLRDVRQTDTTVALLEAAGDFAPAADETGATFGPWCIIPAPAGVVGGTVRQVPASAVIAALIARVDALGNSNRAAAGRDFPLQYVTDFVYEVGMADRAGLFQHGVNAFGNIYGVLENYGFQTNIPQANNTPFWEFNCARGRMYLKDRCQRVAEPYMFKPIDGKGRLAGQLQGAIEHELKLFYDADGLFGDTAADAYSVKVTETVSDVAQGELDVTADAVLSLSAQGVNINLVSVPVGNPV